MKGKKAYDYFHEALPQSASVETSSKYPSMLHLPSKDSVDTDLGEPVYNCMDLDDLDAARAFKGMRKNERADASGEAIRLEQQILAKQKSKNNDLKL